MSRTWGSLAVAPGVVPLLSILCLRFCKEISFAERVTKLSLKPQTQCKPLLPAGEVDASAEEGAERETPGFEFEASFLSPLPAAPAGCHSVTSEPRLPHLYVRLQLHLTGLFWELN